MLLASDISDEVRNDLTGNYFALGAESEIKAADGDICTKGGLQNIG